MTISVTYPSFMIRSCPAQRCCTVVTAIVNKKKREYVISYRYEQRSNYYYGLRWVGGDNYHQINGRLATPLSSSNYATTNMKIEECVHLDLFCIKIISS